jgi:hypothetical protein
MERRRFVGLAALGAAGALTGCVSPDAITLPTASEPPSPPYPVLPHELGVLRDRLPYTDGRRYGCTDDNGLTDNRPLILNAMHMARLLGHGVVTLPPTSRTSWYGIGGALPGISDVTVTGGGWIRNTLNGAFTSTQIHQLGGCFRIGGVEGGPPYWIDAETFYDCGYGFAGQSGVTCGSAADAASFAAGCHVFIRSAAQDDRYTQKAIPLYTEVNEVTRVDGGTVTFKYPLRHDYGRCRIARAGTRPDPYNPGHFYTEVVARFNLRNLRLSTSEHSWHAVLMYGGMFECTFEDLEISHAGELVMANAISRCAFRRIHGKTFLGGGEVGYYSHDNTFDEIRLGHFVHPASVAGGGTDPEWNPRNGWNWTESASYNTMTNSDLSFRGSGSAFVMGTGIGNVLRHSTIRSARCEALGAIDITARGLQYKARGCVVDDVDLYVDDRDDAGEYRIARFGVILDSGGTYGGGNTIRDLRVSGRPIVAAVGLARLDKRYGEASNAPCRGNLVDGVSWTPGAGGTGDPITLPAVVEWNNTAPDQDGMEWVIDPGFRMGDNEIRNVATGNRQVQTRVVPATPEGNQYTQLDETLANWHLIRHSPGTHSRFHVEAHGYASGTTGRKRAALFVGDTQVAEAQFAAADGGPWRIVAEVTGAVPPSWGAYANASLLPRRQVTTASVLVENTTSAQAVSSQHATTTTHQVITAGLRIELRAQVGDPGCVLGVSGWTVTPLDTQCSLIDWSALGAHWGGYPAI